MEENVNPQEKVIQQPQTAPEVPPVPAKQKNIPMLVMIILTTLSLLFSGYLFYQNTQLKKQVAQSPTTATPLPTTDPTTNWTNYSNAVENFTFRYPETWIIDTTNEMGDERKENVKLILTKGQAEIVIFANLVGIGGIGQTYEGETFTLDGNSLYLYNKADTQNNTQFLGVTDSLTESIGVFILNGKTYSITVSYPSSYSQTESDGTEEDFRQILSTFEFIDGVQDGLETYTNTKYKYSFIYPESYIVGQNGMNSQTPELSSHILAYVLDKSPDGPRFSVSVTQKDEETLEEKANKHFNEYDDYSIPNYDVDAVNQVISNITQTEFQGKEAYTYIIKGQYMNDGASEGIFPLYERTFLWFENDGNTFFIRIDNLTPTDQIISTFKFVD